MIQIDHESHLYNYKVTEGTRNYKHVALLCSGTKEDKVSASVLQSVLPRHLRDSEPNW